MVLAQKIAALWRILDDIDTLDDACKGDDALFRRSVYAMQRRRFEIVSGEEFDELSANPLILKQ